MELFPLVQTNNIVYLNLFVCGATFSLQFLKKVKKSDQKMMLLFKNKQTIVTFQAFFI